MSNRPNKKHLLANSAPKMLRSLDGANSMRKRLLSSSQSERSFTGLSPKIGFKNSKLYRSYSRTVNGKPISTLCYCNKFMDDSTSVKLLRYGTAESFNITATVSGLKKKRFMKKQIKLEDSVLHILAADVMSPTRNDKVKILIHNIVSLKMKKDQKELTIEAMMRKKDNNDCTSLKTPVKTDKFVFRFQTERQTEYVAKLLLREIDILATVIDFKLGTIELNGCKPENKQHIECMFRKRVNLYSICKSEMSDCVQFSLKSLIDYFIKNEKLFSAKLWEGYMTGDSKGLLEKLPLDGLNDIRAEREKNFKDNLPMIEETMGSLFFGIGEEKKKSLSTSYYMQMYVQNKLQECD